MVGWGGAGIKLGSGHLQVLEAKLSITWESVCVSGSPSCHCAELGVGLWVQVV